MRYGTCTGTIKWPQMYYTVPVLIGEKEEGPIFFQILVQVRVPPSPSELVLPGPYTSTVQYKRKSVNIMIPEAITLRDKCACLCDGGS